MIQILSYLYVFYSSVVMTVLSCGIFDRSFSFFDDINASIKLSLLSFALFSFNRDLDSSDKDPFPFLDPTFGALWGPVDTVPAEFLENKMYHSE